MADGVSPDIAAQEAARWRERSEEASRRLSEQYLEQSRRQWELKRLESTTWWERRIIFDPLGRFSAITIGWFFIVGLVSRIRRFLGRKPVGELAYAWGFFFGIPMLIDNDSTRWLGISLICFVGILLGWAIISRRESKVSSV